jgi:hypothetical protein
LDRVSRGTYWGFIQADLNDFSFFTVRFALIGIMRENNMDDDLDQEGSLFISQHDLI